MAHLPRPTHLTRMALIASLTAASLVSHGPAQASGAKELPTKTTALATLRALGLSCESLVSTSPTISDGLETAQNSKPQSQKLISSKDLKEILKTNTAGAPGDQVIRQGFEELLKGYDMLLSSLKAIDPSNEKQAAVFQADFDVLVQKVELYRQEIQSSFDGWLAPELNQSTMVKVLQSRDHLDQLFAEIRLFEARARTTELQAPAPHMAIAHRIYEFAVPKGETPIKVRFGNDITQEFLRSDEISTKASAIMFIETLKAGRKKVDFEDGKKVRGYQRFSERVFVKNLKTPGLGEFIDVEFAEVKLENGPRIFAVVDKEIFHFVLVSGNTDTSMLTRHLLAEDTFDAFQTENWLNKKP